MPDWTSPLAHTYDSERPEPYFASFEALGYVQPDNMLAAVERLYPLLGEGAPILDLACGYGTFGALARHFGSMAALTEAAAEGRLVDPAALERRSGPLAGVPIVGLDIAAAAVGFARAAGFIDEGVTEDLTRRPASPAAADAIARCRLVIEVGAEWAALGRLFPNLLAAFGPARPAFLLGPRGDAPTAAVFDALAVAGYRGERLTHDPLRFRAFRDEAEGEAARAREAEAGAIAPSDRTGYRTHLFLFRPGAA